MPNHNNIGLPDTMEIVQPELLPIIDTADKANDMPLDSEISGPKGLEPTRYGDWERKGRCIDF